MKQALIAGWFFVGLMFYHLYVVAQDNSENPNTRISGKINFDNNYSVFISFSNKTEGDQRKTEKTGITSAGTFSWQSYIGKPQFIKMSVIPEKRDRQLPTTFPLYLQPGDNLTLNLQYSDSTFLTLNSGRISDANKALLLYSNFSNLKRKDLFMHTPEPDNSKEYLLDFIRKSDELIHGLKKNDSVVKEYLKIWGFVDYWEGVNSLVYLYKHKGSDSKPEDFYNLSESPKEIYDNGQTLLFPQSYSQIVQYINKADGREHTGKNSIDNLKNSLATLKESFTNKEVIQWVASKLLDSYVRQFRMTDYSQFDHQVSEFGKLAEIIEDTLQRDQLIHDFAGLRYTFKGSEMPDVVFKDLKGKDIKLRSFLGKYVYIDLWASWCVPCIAEVPYLKKLESENKSKNITFISLSVDASTDAWKNKVKQLKLHGNQLEVGDSGYEKLMNVSGIPHFILYDPQGKLLIYKAPRPSSTEIADLFHKILQ